LNLLAALDQHMPHSRVVPLRGYHIEVMLVGLSLSVASTSLNSVAGDISLSILAVRSRPAAPDTILGTPASKVVEFRPFWSKKYD